MGMKTWLQTTVLVTKNSKEMYGDAYICIPRILKNMQSNKYQYQLDNGLECVMVSSNEKAFVDKVSLALTIKCGSMDSSPYKKETAHLLEHTLMEFDKEKKEPKKYFFTKARTNFFSTTYYISCSIKSLECCIALLANIYSTDKITNDNRIQSLKEILRESNNRYYDKRSDHQKNLYLFKDSIFEKYLLNTEIENALKITINDLREFHRKFYTTTNSQLAVVLYGTINDFSVYKESVEKFFGCIQKRKVEKKEINTTGVSICNNYTYSFKNTHYINKTVTIFEIKQNEDFITEKIKKGLFIQYTQHLIKDYFRRKNIVLVEFSINQFENHSFIFNFVFKDIVDGKKLVDEMCYFLLKNPNIIQKEILILRDEIMEVTFSSHELLDFIISSFAYSQPYAYESTEKLVKRTELIIKNFNVDSIINVIKDLKETTYKSFIFE